MLEPGVDFSSYTPNVDYQNISCLMQKYGVEWASIGLTGNSRFDEQMRECIAANIKIDSYIIPQTWFSPAAGIVSKQLGRMTIWRPHLADLVWLDAEVLDEPDPDPALVIQWLWDAIRLCEAKGWEPGIYTSKSMWQKLTNDSHEFRRYKIWEALYGPYASFMPFGGWINRTGVQWQGSTTLCDLNVDLNTWETRVQDMTDEQIKGLIGEVLALDIRNQDKIEAVKGEMLIQGYLLATNRDDQAKQRIEFEAAAGAVKLP